MAGKQKILIVDKDEDLMQSLKTFLEKQGYQVITTNNENRALDLVKNENPNLVIVELMLEKHDSGFEFTKALKANPALCEVKVLMLSSAKEKTGTEFSQKLDGYWMKTDDFLNKPVDSDTVLEKVRRLLND